jgi:PAS domain S-box-containing protein
VKVKDIMTKKIYILKEKDTLGDAARLFIEHRIDGAPVIGDGGEIINIITKTDLMRAFVNKLSLDTLIGEAKRKNVITVDEEADLKEAWGIKVGRLPVVNSRGEMVGILTRTDLSYEYIIKMMKEVEELKHSNLTWNELDEVIESSYDGIFITDGDANTLKINKSYERITGLKRELLMGKNMGELEAKKIISQSASLVVLKKRSTVTIDQKFETGKKAIVTSTPIFDAGNNIVLIVTNVRDVTELYELKEELQKKHELTEKYYSELEEMRRQLFASSDIIAKDPKMLEVLETANRVSKVDTTVMLLGETGVGKEEIAKYIHKNSGRSDKQFIKINCGAIPQNLIETELFGYEKGAFTGANKEGKIGLFEIASGGTVFLDEVGELPLDMQVKLLRVLQEHEIDRVGGVMPIKVDIRVITATNRDLKDMVCKKLFREDLYYRLNVVPITIPPLRERNQDIIALVKYFEAQLNEKYKIQRSYASDALNCMYEYSWPGNVRELKNIVERTMVMSRSDVIRRCDLPKEIALNGIETAVNIINEGQTLKDVLEAVEKNMITKAFEKYGNVRSAAKALGIDSSTFVRKRQKYTMKQVE